MRIRIGRHSGQLGGSCEREVGFARLVASSRTCVMVGFNVLVSKFGVVNDWNKYWSNIYFSNFIR